MWPNLHVCRADGGLIFRISSERSFYGRRNATICAGKVLHYVDVCKQVAEVGGKVIMTCKELMGPDPRAALKY